MKTKSFSLYLLLSLYALFISVTSAIRRSHGEDCSKIHKCDRTAWLSCRDGKCDCSKPDEMLYDEGTKTCVTKSGERCKYGLDESEESSLVEITECVSNANCSSDGVCLCDSKYFETYNGTCGLSILFGESCSEEAQCSKYVGLHCVDSKCQCEYGVYSEEKGLCVGLSQSDCLRNECVEGAVCVQGKCLCDSKHFHSPQKTCVPRKTIFQNCERDVECLQTDSLNLRCISGNCTCADKFVYSVVQKFEYSVRNGFRTGNGYRPFEIGFTGPEVEMCAPRLGEKCPDGYCMENSFCEADEQDSDSYTTFSGSCKCMNEKFSPNKNFQYCAKSYDQDCTDDSDCIDDLVCSKRKCSCPSPWHQFYDSSTRSCVTKVGGHCTNESACVLNSECVFLSSSSRSGHCRCQTDFVVNKDRECDQGFGTKCNETNSKCDSAAGLICVDNKCSCPDTMYEYNLKFRKCLGLVGARCNTEEERIIECASKSENAENLDICDITPHSKLTCVVNAYCNKEHSLLESECKCLVGYEETEDHTCVIISKPSASVICDSSEFRCDDLSSCIETESRCDGKIDCSDRSDEKDCTVKVIHHYNATCNLHTCNNGQCISNEWVCDGIVHCDDSSDEINCPEIDAKNMTTDSGNTAVRAVCSADDQWTCRSGQCIARSSFCNGQNDCIDQSDEPEGCQVCQSSSIYYGHRYISHSQFKCLNGDCIDRSLLCNGKKDCTDGSDETICVK